MKKNYLLFLALFLLSGCSVEYNLEFNDEILEEEIILGPLTENAKAELDFIEPYAIDNYDYQELYNVDITDTTLKLNYKYSKNLYDMSNSLNECYDLSNFSYDDEYYYLLTSNEFKCLNYAGYETDEVRINFKTNYNVVSTNADYTDDDTYTWIINNSNYQNKPIEIKLEKKDYTKKDDSNNKGNPLMFWLIVGIAAVILILVGINIKKKIDRRDEI